MQWTMFSQFINDTNELLRNLSQPLDASGSNIQDTDDEKHLKLHFQGGRILQECTKRLSTILFLTTFQILRHFHDVFWQSCEGTSFDTRDHISI